MTLFSMLESIKMPYTTSVSDFEVHSLLPLEHAKNNDISYIDQDKYLPLLANTNAGAVLVNDKRKDLPHKNLIFVENPHLAFALLSQFFITPQIQKVSTQKVDSADIKIHQGAFIGSNVSIGKGTEIMPNAVICDNVIIGENCKIYPNVVIYKNTIMGNNVNIHANSAIGVDGFGYAHDKLGAHHKIEHTGNVVIEDDVEIGANTTIDRAVFTSTIIKKGAKIDNLVQIGHNCVVGEHSVLVAQVGFAGSTTTGRNVVCGGQAGTGGHVHIGDFTQVAGRGAVTKNLPPHTKWGGHPLMELNEWLKMNVKLRKLTRDK